MYIIRYFKASELAIKIISFKKVNLQKKRKKSRLLCNYIDLTKFTRFKPVKHRSIIRSADLSTDGCIWVTSSKMHWSGHKAERAWGLKWEVLKSQWREIQEFSTGPTSPIVSPKFWPGCPGEQWWDFFFSSPARSRGPSLLSAWHSTGPPEKLL